MKKEIKIVAMLCLATILIMTSMTCVWFGFKISEIHNIEQTKQGLEETLHETRQLARHNANELEILPLGQFDKVLVFPVTIEDITALDETAEASSSLVSKAERTLRIQRQLATYVIKTPMSTVISPGYNGRLGRLQAAEIGLDVGLIYSNEQSVVDAANTAAVLELGQLPGNGGTTIIGDHNNQDFAALARVKVGQKFYLTTDYGEFLYQVSGTMIGNNTGILESTSGESLMNSNPGGVILYTCYPFSGSNGLTIFLVYLTLIEGTVCN